MRETFDRPLNIGDLVITWLEVSSKKPIFGLVLDSTHVFNGSQKICYNDYYTVYKVENPTPDEQKIRESFISQYQGQMQDRAAKKEMISNITAGKIYSWHGGVRICLGKVSGLLTQNDTPKTDYLFLSLCEYKLNYRGSNQGYSEETFQYIADLSNIIRLGIVQGNLILDINDLITNGIKFGEYANNYAMCFTDSKEGIATEYPVKAQIVGNAPGTQYTLVSKNETYNIEFRKTRK